MQNSPKQSKLHAFLTRFEEFLVAGKELMQNPVFVCHCLAVNIPRFVVDGTSPFAVKILLAKYGISATKVGLALAASGAPGIIRKGFLVLCTAELGIKIPFEELLFYKPG